ncbi:aa3-type cytochrome c oxidase subunit IV [uncultured Tateyamaria sp.]|nr:aa3-type cytochrome c oxidase subunit IV [uncultured Tateyamaria sp.]
MSDHKHGEMDTKTHEKTFDAFMQWTTWSVVAILVLIVGMAIFIS